jgi:hypothetical protein
MIRMPHAHSNISIIVKLGVINSQFYEFVTLRSCERFFVSQMVNVIILLKNKGLLLLKRIRRLLDKQKLLFGILAFGVF